MFSLLNDSEMWLDIEGYEGLYSISNMGRVYSHINDIIMKGSPNDQRYVLVGLWKDRIRKTFSIHVLVGNAFIGKRTKEFPEFDHMDRNRTNNCADNLRLATRLEQCENTGVRSTNKLGEKHIRISRNSYRVTIIRNQEFVFDKSYLKKDYTLEDVVEERNRFLNN